ncbi:phosphatase PAP2 family protein [Taibaiella sp. KBW10]|uniref:phosphatase PAP2 family protein n=1 Tax=Taibaiella sp. KBW10 TaxID=2153357 RepID=UPI000F59C228|nr:phosphatase PAP2 family protein [Taibaiella sp. KBW10]RQO30902.1 phosphatase PAP2 family protein [Taibaiella sp. KBW10]
MLAELLELDRSLFLKINTEWTSHFLDLIMPVWRDAKTWLPLYILIVAYLVYRFGLKVWPWFLFVGVMMLCSDQLSSHLIKPWVARIRPCNEPLLQGQVRKVLGYCSGSYSFTSSHAVNHFCIAAFIIFTLRRHTGKAIYLFFPWAFSIAYGQVYVGVHYPLDILCGALLGTGIGYLFATIYNKRLGLPSLRNSRLSTP